MLWLGGVRKDREYFPFKEYREKVRKEKSVIDSESQDFVKETEFDDALTHDKETPHTVRVESSHALAQNTNTSASLGAPGSHRRHFFNQNSSRKKDLSKSGLVIKKTLLKLKNPKNPNLGSLKLLLLCLLLRLFRVLACLMGLIPTLKLLQPFLTLLYKIPVL